MSGNKKKTKKAVVRGKPNTPEGIARVTENLKPQVKHSLNYFKNHPNKIAQSCSLCPFKSKCEFGDMENENCIPVMEYQAEIVDEISALPYIKSQDRFLVYRFAHIQTRLMVIDKWLNEIAGNFRIANDAIDVQPLARQRSSDEKTLMKLADKLCLNPDSRSRMGIAVAASYSLARSLMNINEDEDD